MSFLKKKQFVSDMLILAMFVSFFFAVQVCDRCNGPPNVPTGGTQLVD